MIIGSVGGNGACSMNLQQAFSPGVSVSVFGSGLFGEVRPTGAGDIPLNGWRAGLILNLAPGVIQ